MQQLANIVLKINQFGSTVALKHVTPAEVMLLVAEHNSNAGGNPVVKLEVLDDDAEKKPIKQLQTEIAELEHKREELNAVEMPLEVREKRDGQLASAIRVKQDKLEELRRIVVLRGLAPKDERVRLFGKYITGRVKRFYPGSLPTLPSNFEEAQSAGLEAAIEREDHLMVADGTR